MLLWASLQRRRLVFGHGFYRGLLLGVQTHFARPVYSITTIQNCCAMHFPSTLRDETADLRVEAPSIEKEQAREGDFVTTDGAYQNGSSCETNNRHTYTHSNSRRSLLTGTEPTHTHTHTASASHATSRAQVSVGYMAIIILGHGNGAGPAEAHFRFDIPLVYINGVSWVGRNGRSWRGVSIAQHTLNHTIISNVGSSSTTHTIVLIFIGGGSGRSRDRAGHGMKRRNRECCHCTTRNFTPAERTERERASKSLTRQIPNS